MQTSALIAVIRADSPTQLVDVCRALCDGGVDVAEQGQAADQAPFLGQHGEDEVCLLLGQEVEPPLGAGHVAATEQAASAAVAAARIEAALTPAGFDADRVAQIIDQAQIPQIQKETLKNLVTSAGQDPALLREALVGPESGPLESPRRISRSSGAQPRYSQARFCTAAITP